MLILSSHYDVSCLCSLSTFRIDPPANPAIISNLTCTGYEYSDGARTFNCTFLQPPLEGCTAGDSAAVSCCEGHIHTRIHAHACTHGQIYTPHAICHSLSLSRTQTHTCVCACRHTHTCAHTQTLTHTRMHTHTHTYIHTLTRTCTHTHTHTYIHTLTRTCIHTNDNTY